MTKKRQILLTIFWIIILLIIFFCIKAYLFFNARPNIAINYAAEINKLTRPENYDPCQNAFFDYEIVASHIIDMPEITQSKDGVPPWPSWPGDMKENQLKDVKDWLLANNQALEHFEQSSKKPYYWQQMPEENTMTWRLIASNLWKYRISSIALCTRAKIDALEGQTRKAFNETIACLVVGNHLIKSKRTLEQMVGRDILKISVSAMFEMLYNTKLKSEELAWIQKEIEEKIDKNLKFSFEIDKMIIKDFIQHIFSDDGRGNGHLIPKEAQKIWEQNYIIQPQKRSLLDFLKEVFSQKPRISNTETRPFFRRAIEGPDRKQTMEKLNEIYTDFDDYQKKTTWQLYNQGLDPYQKSINKINSDWLIKDIGNFLYYYPIELIRRSKTEQSALIATIAILRFKADKGNFPDNLYELIKPGYLKELPEDPYNEGSLTYRRMGEDFTLYSLGPDLNNGGGIRAEGLGFYSQAWWYNPDTVFWPVTIKEEKKE